MWDERKALDWDETQHVCREEIGDQLRALSRLSLAIVLQTARDLVADCTLPPNPSKYQIIRQRANLAAKSDALAFVYGEENREESRGPSASPCQLDLFIARVSEVLEPRAAVSQEKAAFGFTLADCVHHMNAYQDWRRERDGLVGYDFSEERLRKMLLQQPERLAEVAMQVLKKESLVVAAESSVETTPRTPSMKKRRRRSAIASDRDFSVTQQNVVENALVLSPQEIG